MRKDMFKVIVERPRRGAGWDLERRLPVDEDSASRESVRARHVYRKYLNENLRPLERYLHRQIGRPWDKVYAEICAGIDRRNTVQQHIHLHLADFVAMQVIEVDGQPHQPSRWGALEPLSDLWSPRLYVDPATGLLRVNRARQRELRRAEAVREARKAPPVHRRDLAQWHQLHRVQGIWYDVELAPIPDAARGPGAYDVIRQKHVVSPGHRGAGKHVIGGDARLYGRADVYARQKRQLSARELRQHRLDNSQ